MEGDYRPGKVSTSGARRTKPTESSGWGFVTLPLLLLSFVGSAGQVEHQGAQAAPGSGKPEPNPVSGVRQDTDRLDAALERLVLPDDFRQKQETLLAEAQRGAKASPHDPHALIWVGRRLGYLGRYEEAIALFSQGITRWPEMPHLYRHRGHRYITLRRFDLAEADLERAAALTRGQADEIEPDGLPNDRGIPTSTLHSNIWYHLGLARYLRGDFDSALEAYRECLRVSKNPDMLVATSYWLYLTLRRAGRQEEARAVLDPIHPEMDIIENRDYQRLLLTFKGSSPVADLEEELTSQGDLSLATVGYGLGVFYLLEGSDIRARDLFRRVVEEGNPAAFGFIAAESELRRWEGS